MTFKSACAFTLTVASIAAMSPLAVAADKTTAPKLVWYEDEGKLAGILDTIDDTSKISPRLSP